MDGVYGLRSIVRGLILHKKRAARG